jgi:hypothetical protein
LGITLDWNDAGNLFGVPGQYGYSIERSLNGVTNWNSIGTNGVSTFIDVGVNIGTTYYYRVRAFNPLAFGPYSNVANAVVSGALPADPTNLTAVAVSTSEIDIDWDDTDTSVTFTTVERSLDNVTFSVVTTVSGSITAYNDTGLSSGTLYYYRVRATNPFGVSNYSNVASATTSSSPVPNPVTMLIATAVSQSQINLAWVNNGGATSNKVQRSLDGVTNWTLIFTAGGSVAFYQDIGLAQATTYYYRVIASNASGDANPSNVASATTQGTSPLNVPVIRPRLIWNTPTRLSLLQTWWAANSFIPVDPPGPTAYQRLAIAYQATTGATQAGHLAKMITLLFSEDINANPGGLGYF